jgi:hypothetical protein
MFETIVNLPRMHYGRLCFLRGRPSLAISLSLCRQVQDARSRILPRGYSRLGQVASQVFS